MTYVVTKKGGKKLTKTIGEVDIGHCAEVPPAFHKIILTFSNYIIGKNTAFCPALFVLV